MFQSYHILYSRYFSHKILLPCKRNLRGPDGKVLDTAGYIQCEMANDRYVIKEDLYILRGCGNTLLGRDGSVKLGIVL